MEQIRFEFVPRGRKKILSVAENNESGYIKGPAAAKRQSQQRKIH